MTNLMVKIFPAAALLLSAAACIWPKPLASMSGLIVPMLVRKKGSRLQGGLLLLGYIAYCVYSFLAG